MQEILRKLRRDPIRAPLRGLYKTLVASRKYRSGQSYDARAYWGDRFERYGQSLRGPGDEGLSHEENEAEYAQAAKVLIGVCRDQGVDFEHASVLDIGCGTGFYAGILQELGVREYVGVDITDVLFPELRERFPDFEFIRKDVAEEDLDGEFDLILMIDVIEHIVDESKLTAALANVEQALAPAGVFVLAPVAKAGRRRFFYVRLWTLEDVRSRLQGFVLTDPIPFRTESIAAARRALPPPS